MAKRGGFPGGMPGNMNNLMKQAQRMQRQMEEAQQKLETMESTATAGGGAVEVTVSGKKEVLKVKLAEELIKNGVTASEAAFRVGYDSYLTFYYNYKRVIGQPPSQSKK